MTKSYYSILGVADGASFQEIKQAHRTLSAKYHPDVATAPDAAQKYQAIQEAFAVLSNPDKRQRYDKMLNESMPTELLNQFRKVQRVKQTVIKSEPTTDSYPRFGDFSPLFQIKKTNL